MKKIHLALAAVACLSGLASAGGPAAGSKFFLLGDFPTATETEDDFAAEYFGKTYGNKTTVCPGCKAELISTKDATGDYARMNYTLVDGAASATYFANVGVMLPLDNLWSSANDLRAMTNVWFKARTNSGYADGINLKVNLDGPAFPYGSAGYTRLKTVVVTGEWTWYKIGIKEFAYASWMKDDATAAKKVVTVIDNLADGSTAERSVTISKRAVAGKLLNVDSATSTDYDNDSVNALKNIKMIQFGIDPVYGTGGTALDPDYLAGNSAKNLDIDSVIFEGVDGGWSPLEGKGCTGASETIEDFDASNPKKGSMTANYAGGYWFAYSDTSSAEPVAGKDSAVGKSSVDPVDPTDPESVWGINSDAEVVSADMLAKLNKGDVAKHPYAGWAELGTSLVDAKKKAAGKNGTGLKAIEFEIRAGGTDPFEVKFDKAKLIGVTFKVAKASVSDDVTYEAKIPFGQINANANSGDFVKVCADVSAMKQPAWYTAKNGVKAMTPDSLTQLSWAVKIQKNKDLSATPTLIQVKSVKFYGTTNFVGVKGAAARGTKSLEASYGKGLVVSYSVPGAKAEIEVVRMDGSKIASFTNAASVKSLSLPVSLNNGTYMVVVRGEGARQTVTLPVVGK